jgi:antitoxin (DNA-binding transcriptional repressor) of toxin-antitoxin stability system
MNQTIFMTMKTVMVNINEAKTHLSEYARRVKRGGRVILCDRNKPFAEIRPLRLTKEGRRPFGLARGVIEVPPDFLTTDDEIEALFAGE